MPDRRKEAKQARQAGITAALEDCLNHIRRQQRYTQVSPQKGAVNPIGRRQFGQRNLPAQTISMEQSSRRGPKRRISQNAQNRNARDPHKHPLRGKLQTAIKDQLTQALV